MSRRKIVASQMAIVYLTMVGTDTTKPIAPAVRKQQTQTQHPWHRSTRGADSVLTAVVHRHRQLSRHLGVSHRKVIEMIHSTAYLCRQATRSTLFWIIVRFCTLPNGTPLMPLQTLKIWVLYTTGSSKAPERKQHIFLISYQWLSTVHAAFTQFSRWPRYIE
jgi:hypothetical protein